MKPQTYDMLSLAVGTADRMVKAGRASGDPRDLAALELLLATAQEARTWPNDPGEKPYVDDCTTMMLQCLRLAERDGPLGESLKWILLAEKFLPHVRPQLARALTATMRPTA